MNISVVLSTCRLGGFDVTFSGLENQTFKGDWELIIVDEWYELRRHMMSRLERIPSFKHLPPKVKKPYRAISNGFNTGLIHAEGELVCFLNDYVWVPPDWLETHWKIWKNTGYSHSGYIDRYSRPPLRRYRTLEEICFTAFERPFIPETFGELKLTYEERKGGKPALGSPITESLEEGFLYEIDGRLFYQGLNESIPLDIVVRLNGLDERFDGQTANQDADLGIRANMLGHRFAIDPTLITREIEHQGIPCHTDRTLKPNEEGYRFLLEKEKRMKAGLEPLEAPNIFCLADERRKIGL